MVHYASLPFCRFSFVGQARQARQVIHVVHLLDEGELVIAVDDDLDGRGVEDLLVVKGLADDEILPVSRIFHNVARNPEEPTWDQLVDMSSRHVKLVMFIIR